MYVSSNMSIGQLPLFGGDVRASNPSLTWGREALELLVRPTSSVQPIFPLAVPHLVPLPVPPVGTGSYYDWVNSMHQFRDAATGNSRNAGGTGG